MLKEKKNRRVPKVAGCGWTNKLESASCPGFAILQPLLLFRLLILPLFQNLYKISINVHSSLEKREYEIKKKRGLSRIKHVFSTFTYQLNDARHYFR